jgi:hypothetical protein
MHRLIKWLYDQDEGRAADWLKEYWSGDRGNWDLGASGLCCPNTNCGVESGWARIRRAVCGGLRRFTFSQFMTLFLTYETEQSIDDMRGRIMDADNIFQTKKMHHSKSITSASQ